MPTTKSKTAADEAEERRPPERVLDLGQGLELWRVHVDDLHEQELNAQAMPPAMFERLSATIGRDGRLESLPLCGMVNDRLEIISGHHRVRASRAAGVAYVWTIVDITGLTADQVKAKQLAHNAIHGQSEEQIVARIYAQISDVDARLEAFVTPPDIEIIPPRVSLPNLDLDLAYRTVLITFLPHQADQFETAVKQITEQVDLDRDHLYLVDRSLYEQWQALTRRIGREYDARALSTVVSRIITTTAQALGLDGADPDELDPHAHTPLAELLGTALVPPRTAAVIQTVVDEALARNTVTKSTRHRLVEEVFAAYADAHHITLPDDDDPSEPADGQP
ncbi:hypothetical protein F5972_08400 [Microbispora cellulosiformans]|uniref:ParB-like N-terminal domain-containing protein n=1 Tax=Microbispora cellulosiformans TaxID=2614688 RepID=A0A5J5K878_9ACTN|nr:ParB N-terminal domain-containing protein [Microbispora cellulosiformans]KAA9379663.1 hypothetical protein F5972_08400 [Microbispora cellulosiformans]